MVLVGILRAPVGGEASAWYRPRPFVPIPRLVALLGGAAATTVLHLGHDEAHVAVDAGDGRNVGVRLGPDGVRLFAVLEDPRIEDEEHGTEEEDDAVDAPVEECVEAIITVLQAATGWYYFDEDAGLMSEPEGACPACATEFFQGQDACPACGAELDSDEGAPDDDVDQRASTLARALLSGGHLELCTPRDRAIVEGRLGGCLSRGAKTREILDMLVGLPAVAEVYCDEETLAGLLRRTRRRPRPGKRPRSTGGAT